MRLLHEVAEYVEGFGDEGIVGSAVDERRARGREEGEVDMVGGVVFLVMAHQGEQTRIVVTGEVGRAVGVLLEIGGIAVKLSRGETFYHV